MRSKIIPLVISSVAIFSQQSFAQTKEQSWSCNLTHSVLVAYGKDGPLVKLDKPEVSKALSINTGVKVNFDKTDYFFEGKNQDDIFVYFNRDKTKSASLLMDNASGKIVITVGTMISDGKKNLRHGIEFIGSCTKK